MNYRHAYHAGNFADVVKHAVLALVIEHLKLKPAPFRVIDTHAGIGVYDLASEAAQKTGEWREGIGRVDGRRSCRRPRQRYWRPISTSCGGSIPAARSRAIRAARCSRAS